MPIRRLVPSDAAEYRALMLDGYARHPEAFTATPDERAHLPLSFWETRLGESVVFGAFDGAHLVGVAGLTFETRPRTRHKATLFGMYVAPEARAHGFGRGLVEACLAHARSQEDILIVQLTVTEGNAPAQRLYERCGFTSFGVEPYAVATETGYTGKVHLWCPVKPLPAPR